MKKLILSIFLLSTGGLLSAQNTQNKPLKIIAFGAHPDDCDAKFGGTAALYAKMGHQVKFVSLTNGDAGHQSEGGGFLGKRRRAEAQKAAEILNITYDVLDNHDGELIPTIHVRHQVIRKIREWDADIVLGLRPNDYHPDHRNAGIVVQDAAYLVIVPNVTPDTAPLKKNPVFLYMKDNFKKPYPFSKDIAIVIDAVVDQKIRALAAHSSQMFEWLPWVSGVEKKEIPINEIDRLAWLKKRYSTQIVWNEKNIALLKKWYPNVENTSVKHLEFFEICEYGKQPSTSEIKKLFPMLK
jgi:LmbE family N-acetylglucosaminyl deacetylase